MRWKERQEPMNAHTKQNKRIKKKWKEIKTIATIIRWYDAGEKYTLWKYVSIYGKENKKTKNKK